MSEHKSAKKGSASVVITLVLTFIITAAAVAVVNSFTEPVITKYKKDAEEARKGAGAVLAVATKFFPTATNLKPLGSWTKDENKGALYTVFEKDNPIGYTIETFGKGYQSVLQVQVGVDNNGIVQGIEVVSQAETPGLGDQTMLPEFSSQFKNKDIDHIVITTSGKEGLINAIGGATVSSRAVTEDAVKRGVEYLHKNILKK